MKKDRTAIKIAFTAYVILMLWLLFGRRIGRGPAGAYFEVLSENINLIPFATVTRYIKVVKNSVHAVVNLAGNIIMFVPLGFFMPFIWEKTANFKEHLKLSAVTVTAIEIIQLLTLLGSCDIDDLILNTAGTTVGFLLWKMTEK